MADRSVHVDYSSLKAGLLMLSDDMKRRSAFLASAAGARVIQKLAIQNAKTVPSGDVPGLVDTGALIRNIAIARQKVQKGGTYYPYHVGVRHGTKKQIKTNNDPWYWWMHEFGWTDRKGVKHKASFLVPAIAASPASSFNAIRASLARSIARAAKAAANRAAGKK